MIPTSPQASVAPRQHSVWRAQWRIVREFSPAHQYDNAPAWCAALTISVCSWGLNPYQRLRFGNISAVARLIDRLPLRPSLSILLCVKGNRIKRLRWGEYYSGFWDWQVAWCLAACEAKKSPQERLWCEPSSNGIEAFSFGWGIIN
jgi:hypothetical protein